MLLGTTCVENPSLYHQASALTHVFPGLPPALFIYGRKDSVVHSRLGQLGLKAWQAHDNYAGYYTWLNIGHGVAIDNQSEMEHVFIKTGDFLEGLFGY